MLFFSVVLTCCTLSVGSCLMLCNVSSWFGTVECLTLCCLFFRACRCNWMFEFGNGATVAGAVCRFICCWAGTEVWTVENVSDAFWLCRCTDGAIPADCRKTADWLGATVHTGAITLCCTAEGVMLLSRAVWVEVRRGDGDAGRVWDCSEDVRVCEDARTGDFCVTCGSVAELARNKSGKWCWRRFRWSFCCRCGSCCCCCGGSRRGAGCSEGCGCDMYSSVLGKLRKSNETSSSIPRGSSASWEDSISSVNILPFLDNNSFTQSDIRSEKRKKKKILMSAAECCSIKQKYKVGQKLVSST